MRKSPIDSKTAGQRNEKLILSLLRINGPLSQVQICKITGLGSSTVSYIVGRLREKALITEYPGKSKTRGAKPVVISINSHGRFIASARISPSNIYIGLFDFNCELIESIKVPLGLDNSVDNVVQLLENNLKGLLSRYEIGQEKIIGIGITLSGSISTDGVVKLSSPLGWKNIPLKNILSEKFTCLVSMHTSRVRLLAEMKNEPTLLSKNILYINVANGVGSTVIIDGNLIHGATNRCGEIGHTIVDPNGPLCGCGQKGCLEAFISGPAIAKKIKKDLAAGTDSVLNGNVRNDDIAEEIIAKWGDALRKKDDYSLTIRDFVTYHLSKVVSAAINYFDPDVIILAGYVCEKCHDFLADAIRQRFASDVYDHLARKIKIIPAGIGEQALIRGTAIAVMQNSIEVK